MKKNKALYLALWILVSLSAQAQRGYDSHLAKSIEEARLVSVHTLPGETVEGKLYQVLDTALVLLDKSYKASYNDSLDAIPDSSFTLIHPRDIGVVAYERSSGNKLMIGLLTTLGLGYIGGVLGYHKAITDYPRGLFDMRREGNALVGGLLGLTFGGGLAYLINNKSHHVKRLAGDREKYQKLVRKLEDDSVVYYYFFYRYGISG